MKNKFDFTPKGVFDSHRKMNSNLICYKKISILSIFLNKNYLTATGHRTHDCTVYCVRSVQFIVH